MELPEINMDDFTKWSLGSSVVSYSDMEDEMRTEAVDYIATGIEKSQSGGELNQEAACKFVKDAMDRQFGPAWHCVLGEGYSFDVTRQANTTMLMYYGGRQAILLFKC